MIERIERGARIETHLRQPELDVLVRRCAWALGRQSVGIPTWTPEPELELDSGASR